MDINDILQHLPHRYPFLLIDRVTEFNAGESLVGYKNVTYNEPFFQGHFPERPIMPGVLILEAMAQATGLLAFKTVERGARRESLYFLVGMDKARFKRPVEPGDRWRCTPNCCAPAGVSGCSIALPASMATWSPARKSCAPNRISSLDRSACRHRSAGGTGR